MPPAERSRPARRRTQSAAAVLGFGLALAVVLAATLFAVAASDRSNRLAAAEQQNLALAAGAERLVWLQLRNLERAMRGIAGDVQRVAVAAPEHLPHLITEFFNGVAQRQQELESLELTDANGMPLSGGRGEPGLADWPDRRTPQPHAQSMLVGPLARHRGEWLLPLALPMDDGRWIVARLRTSELQKLVLHLDADRARLIQLAGNDGRLVADTRGEAHIGEPDDAVVPTSVEPQVMPEDDDDRRDGIKRITVGGVVPDYPLHVDVAIARQRVLAPWWRLVVAGVALYLIYLAGLVYLVRMVRRNARATAQLVERLTEAADNLRRAQQLGRTGTWIADRNGTVCWSEPVTELLGLPEGQSAASIDEFYALVHPDDRGRVSTHFGEAWRSGEPYSLDYRIVRGDDGRVRWISARGAATRDADGTLEMAGTVVDVTDRMEVQLALEETERQFRMLFERNPLPFWVFDIRTLRFVEVNQAAIEQYGYTREEFLAMTIYDIRPEEHRGAVAIDLERHRPGERDEVRLWVHRRKDGRLLEVRVHATDIDFRGRPSRLVLAEDVTERVAQQRELAYRATHDMTSGLLNADALADRVDAMDAGPCRIACVQLRGLELIEDSLGREAGHDTLRVMATRIARLGERFGVAGHVRSDEFVLAVHPVDAWDEALECLLQELGRPIPGEDTLHRLESWIGVADLRTGERQAAQAIANAGLAAHVARTEHRPLVVFEPSMARHAGDRLRLAGRIHRAIDAGEFELHFQILWDVAYARPAGLETLIRWPQRGGDYLPPSQFIGLCEDTGLIVPLGRWALREAAAAQRLLERAGFGDLPIAVNVSLMQFLDGDIAHDIESVLREYALPRGALHIELTESVLMTRPEQALETLRRLQSFGVCLSLDDFGTGFSSMSYLKQLPLDAIKIDQSFVRDVDRDERSASICQALLALGHGLGLKVVGEGVETQAQYEWLAMHGCNQVQGFGIHRPAPLTQAIGTLREMREWQDGPWRGFATASPK
ncbi:EAL domain-containing protein [Lysobacter arvi]|uniref:EAL domain-containing protein n=1 Tax=Lysobacter arvi TaxID=3038776 RepID=A0ABU1CI93_9GAMM|nr:EAL domain-containing protein [Lysobacter arvi]MDR0184665.1 EAL domain-containing protein [Lysobacter arvi]